MPEQITKYPEVTIKVLTAAGARCGEGQTRNYLLCMAEREGFEPPVGCPTTVFKCAAAKLFVFLCQALTRLIL